MKKIGVIVLYLAFFTQNFAQLNKVNTINIKDGFDNNQIVKLSQLAESIEYIPLETNDLCFIGEITQIKRIGNDQIIVLDGKSNKLFRFSRSGKFLGMIGGYGKGPGEYLRIINIEFNPKTNLIYVFDLGSKGVLKYNRDGVFIGKNKLPLLGYWVRMLDNKYFVYFDPARSPKASQGFYRVVLTDLDGNIIKKYQKRKLPKETELKSPCSMQSSVYISDNKAKYWEVTSDSILCVDSNLNIYYSEYLDQGQRSFPKSRMNDAKYVVQKFNDYSTIIWTNETRNYFFCKGLTDHKLACIIYSKETGEVINAANGRNLIINDLDNGPGFWPDGKVDDDYVFTSIEAFDLIELLQKSKVELSKRLKSIAQNADAKDNPILMIVKLKE